MEKFISVFDMFKISVGPSSSHTLGPWLAAINCVQKVESNFGLDKLKSVQVLLYGSLAKTGKGHGTDMAVMMGLMGEDPITTNTDLIVSTIADIKIHKKIIINKNVNISFDHERDLQFLKDQLLTHHPNGLQFIVTIGVEKYTYTYYSIGGGFIEEQIEKDNKIIFQPTNINNNIKDIEVPFDFKNSNELLHWCIKTGLPICEIVKENEKTIREEMQVSLALNNIWETMLACIYKGCHTEGELPGGLFVQRRAFALNKKLLKEAQYNNINEWMAAIKNTSQSFSNILDWVSCFALAVNEQNASFGRVVTAPTNGAAGVVPAVLLYALLFAENKNEEKVSNFLLTASAIGILFKNGATISAAMGGCQAEIGVSSAMAAAALTELLGGNQKQTMMAAEIAMEHHLGLTCDPVGGLVQIPCIERNTMGAIKAITAAQLALQSTPDLALVSLDKVIKTMWNTALDMSVKYKETAEGGLAMQIPIGLAEC
ncbi:MAG: L-serine ammonia-lyase [Chitinophagia bacterium]|jgi:L-serine dehydratase|nr:L-serine ammonia-lyase [Chitinophagia bacterium]